MFAEASLPVLYEGLGGVLSELLLLLSSFLYSVVHIMVKVIISSCGLMQKEM